MSVFTPDEINYLQNQRLARLGIVQHRGIELARDLGLFLDQQTFDLVVADRHAENFRSDLLSFRRRIGELDAAGLAALTHRHLRLDHARPDLRRRNHGVLRAGAQNAARHRNPGRRKHQRFRRVFLEVHLPYLAQ